MDEPPATPVRPEQRPSRAPSRAQAYTLADVRKHNTKEDGWIVVDGIVYDITNFAKNHPGWTAGGMTSTALAIEHALGTECSEEFHELHTPGQLRTLQAYAIGHLAVSLDDAIHIDAATNLGKLLGEDPQIETEEAFDLPEVLLHRICLLLDVRSVARAARSGGALARHVNEYGRGDARHFLPLPLPASRPKVRRASGYWHFCKRHRGEVHPGGGEVLPEEVEGIKARLQGMWHALPDDEKLRWGAEAPMVRGDSVERKPRGISIDGRDVSASPRWMQWNRVLDVLTPLASPQFLFEVEITSMRALTLDIGVAETTQSQNLSLDESYKANCREWYVDGAGRAVQKVRNRDKDEVSFAFGRRYGVGRVVGVYRRGSGVGFSLDGVDLGVAFEDVPRNVHPFVRFPTGGVHGQRGDAVRLAAGRPLILTSGEPPPGPLDGRLVVQQFGPELDDWIDLRVNPRRTTVRTLRKLITTVLNARAARVGAEPASPEIVDVHFLKAIAGSKEDPRARARSGVLRAGLDDSYRSRSGVVAEKLLDRPLESFGLSFLANGIQSRPIYVNLIRDIS